MDKATHVLHIDIVGPSANSDDGLTYFLVGALRLSSFPLLIDVRLLTSGTSVEVCDALVMPSANLLNLRALPSLPPLGLSVSIAIMLENLPLLSLNVLGQSQDHLPHLYLWV